MKITGVISSPSKNGNTAVLVREILKSAEQNGAITDAIFLADYKIDFCRGCFNCLKNGKCVINDDFEMLKEKLLNSDGIVLSSPVYGIAMNARMKNFIIDRLGMPVVYTSGFGGKYLIGVSTGSIMGAKLTAKKLVYDYTAGFFKNAYVSGILYAELNKDFNINRIEIFPKYIEKAKKLGKKIVDDFNKNKKFVFQNFFNKLFIKIIANFVIKKNLNKNKDSIFKAVYENLLERKLI